MKRRLSIILSLALVLLWAGAGECADGYLGELAVATAANASIEQNIRMTIDTMPSGSNKQADSMRVRLARVRADVIEVEQGKGLIYRYFQGADSSLLGETDTLSHDYENQGDTIYTWYFSNPKPTLKADSIYMFGVWSDTVNNATINLKLSITGDHWYLNDPEGWGASGASPAQAGDGGDSPVDATAHLGIVLWYSDIPASGTRLPFMQKVGSVDWKDLEQRFLWPHCRGQFAGSKCLIAN